MRAILTIVVLAFSDDGTFTTNRFFVEQPSLEVCLADAKAREADFKAKALPNRIAIFWCTPLAAPPMGWPLT